MISEELKELVMYTAALPDQEFTARELPGIVEQANHILAKMKGLNLSGNEKEDMNEIIDNLQYTLQEIETAEAAKDYADAEFIINRYLSYVEEAHEFFFETGLRLGLDPYAGN